MSDSSVPIKFNVDPGYGGKKVSPHSKGGKDFKKILAKQEREEERHPDQKKNVEENKEITGKDSYEDVASKLDAYDPKPAKTGVSLFELAASPSPEVEEDIPLVAVSQPQLPEEEEPISEISDEVKEESLSALFQGYGSKEKLRLFQKEADQERVTSPYSKGKTKDTSPLIAVTKESMQTTQPEIPKTKSSPHYEQTGFQEKEKFNVNFAREQPDLASINPLAGSSPLQATQRIEAKVSQPAGMTAQEIQELVDQIATKLYTVKVDGQTDTFIALKHPPLFAGAHVVIKAYDTAKGEFNIAFENLTPAAKQLIDMQESQNSLRFALEQKGFAVHILIATTQTEAFRLPEGEGPARDREEREGFFGRRDDREREDKEK